MGASPSHASGEAAGLPAEHAARAIAESRANSTSDFIGTVVNERRLCFKKVSYDFAADEFFFELLRRRSGLSASRARDVPLVGSRRVLER